MQSVETSPLIHRIGRGGIDADRSTWLSTLTYRSRAVRPMSELELQRLLRAAQTRNRREGITGLVVYDHGRFFQWLEGPADGLARIWDSVQRDARHTGIEIMGNEPTPVRFFGDWDMKLSNRDAGGAPDGAGAFDIPSELIEGLYRYPDAAPALLARLAPVPLAAPTITAVDPSTAPVLAALVSRVVIPRLVALHMPAVVPAPAVHPRAAELAGLLVAADSAGATTLLATFAGMPDREALPHARLAAELAEPTARALGDMWQTDACSELEVSFGLCRLLAGLRRLGVGSMRRTLAVPHSVLVAPAPGEGDMLPAALDAELLWRAGWDIDAEFPADDTALGALLAGTWFDALDLSLSAAFRRADRLPRLAATIASARAASRNPALVIVVGGRVFGEPGGADVHVGADANVASCAQVERTILARLAADIAPA